MGRIISVGQAGAKGRVDGQALSIRLEADGMRARVRVGTDGATAAAREAAQARQVWRSVLAALVDGGRE